MLSHRLGWQPRDWQDSSAEVPQLEKLWVLFPERKSLKSAVRSSFTLHTGDLSLALGNGPSEAKEPDGNWESGSKHRCRHHAYAWGQRENGTRGDSDSLSEWNIPNRGTARQRLQIHAFQAFPGFIQCLLKLLSVYYLIVFQSKIGLWITLWL